ncbi:MAG: ATPase, T2SS/T4P/T4SS family [Patescibacteria group bacterium]
MLTVDQLKELVVTPGHVSAADFATAQAESLAEKRPLSEVLVGRDLMTDENLGRLIAEALALKFFDLKREKIDETTIKLLPEVVARAHGAIVFAATGEEIKLALTEPEDLELVNALAKKTGKNVKIFYTTPRLAAEALNYYRGGLREAVEKLAKDLVSTELSKEARNEASVQLVDNLLAYGEENKSSDIHLEPYRDKLLVRFRIDGVMHDILDLPKAFADLLLTRIKILAKLRTDEHRAAQDGKLQFQYQAQPVDVRVSIVPVTEGENVVLRLLSEESRRFSLTDIGLLAGDLAKVKRAIDNPHGLILVTGPTGSGKTTTVYGMLKLLNKRDVHISTIEDPVEYTVEGVSQIQVNTKTGLTFASGLRSIVRQDPDIIMVGEIRDAETADIAVNSALTGHLVLSTLHANDAPTTLPRLLDMGVEPFLVASTVNVVVAQRLVRRICEKCRFSYALPPDEKTAIDHEPNVKQIFQTKGYKELKNLTLYRGAGCKVCGGTGFAGRVGIFEVLLMSEAIKKLVVDRAPSSEVLVAARGEGMTTMLEDGLEKVLTGVTTLPEILRVIKI